MRNYVKKELMLLILGFIFGFSILLNSNLIYYQGKVSGNVKNDNEPELKRAGYWNVPPFIIDGNSDWHTLNSTYEWCNGAGTWKDPYIIENVTIDGLWSGSCIEIKNSDVFFVIRNCTFVHGGSDPADAGIKLSYTTNGKIMNNTLSLNDRDAIQLEYSDNNTISNNIAKNNYLYGINLITSHNNTVSENILTDSRMGIKSAGSEYNTIVENDASNNEAWGLYLVSSNHNNVSNNDFSNSGYVGILMGSSDDNKIIKNLVKNCGHGPGFSVHDDGIHIDSSDNNSLIENKILDNHDNGINIEHSKYNIISKNIIRESVEYDLKIHSMSYFNTIYENNFRSSSKFLDDGSSNYWDNGTIGNYWSSYYGVDTNDDGIGDTPYNIPGSAGSQDNYPIWWDSPEISINSPSTNDIFDGIPQFNISIDEGIVNTTWYTLDEGLINITFTGLTGNIDQTEWNKRVDGFVTIKFFANDSRGYIGFTEVTVLKESIPQIAINSPTLSEFFGFGAPEFNITVYDLSPINVTWYTIDRGLTNYTFSGFTGFINQIAWEQEEDGVIAITFYANDSLGNLGAKEINITKDTNAPKIAINAPTLNQIYGSTSPSFSLTIDELNLLEKRYSLNGRPNITFTTETQISQLEWDNVGNGTVIIVFFIIDEAGNINSSEVIARKDIYTPEVTIVSPIEDDIFEIIAPSFNVDIQDANLDKRWYKLNFGTQEFLFTSNDTIDQGLWEALPNGIVTLTFYANDTAGNINYTSVNIIKDTLLPEILILSPNLNDIFGIDPPTFELSINEPNLESIWYTIDGGIANYTFSGFTGLVNQTVWDIALEGKINITFYAQDRAGNIGTETVIVIKRIPSHPSISGYNLFILLGVLSVAIIMIERKWRNLRR